MPREYGHHETMKRTGRLVEVHPPASHLTSPEVIAAVLADRKYSQKPYCKYRLQDVQKPRDNALCVGQAWWCVTQDGCVLSYGGTPQCNKQEQLAEAARKHAHPTCTLQFHEMLYIPLRSWELP